MKNEKQLTARDLATLGLALGGPLTLFSGIAVGVTVIAGPPVFLVLLFVAGLGLSALSLLVLAGSAAHPAPESDNDTDLEL